MGNLKNIFVLRNKEKGADVFKTAYRGTALEAWYDTELGKSQRKRGPMPNWRSNKSNAMRIAMLLKYGGAYFDLDAISVQPIIGPNAKVPMNSVGAQTDECANVVDYTNVRPRGMFSKTI